MSSEYARLRRLVNEELKKLDEYRPNAFMLSRMEEQDQDGDGDEDFDDVRIARRKASGMSKAAAISSVKRKPMGNRKDESLAESMTRMSLTERLRLHETVKRVLIREEDASTRATSRIEAYHSSKSDEDGKYDRLDIIEESGYRWAIFRYENESKAVKEKTKGKFLVLLRQAPDEGQIKDSPPYWWIGGGSYKAKNYKTDYQKLINVLETIEGVKTFLSGEYDTDPRSTTAATPEVPTGQGESTIGKKTFDANEDDPEYYAPLEIEQREDVEIQPASGYDTCLPGSTLEKGGKEIFRKTEEGWRSVLQLTKTQVVSLVKPEYRDQIRSQLDKAKDGEEIPLTRAVLQQPTIITSGDSVIMRREGESFTDPTIISSSKMQKISEEMDLDPDWVTGYSWSGDFAIGDAIISFDGMNQENINITIKDDGSGTYRGFKDIFGADSDIPRKIQDAAKKKGIKNPGDLTFDIADSVEGSIIRYFSKNILRGLGIGKIKFVRDRNDYICRLKGVARSKKLRQEIAKYLKEKGATQPSE